MESLFTKLVTRITDEIPEIKWVDLDKGQINQFDSRPALLYPAILIGLQLPRTQDFDTRGKIQECNALVNIRLIIDYTGNTSAATPAIERGKSLNYFTITDKIYRKLQSWGDEEFNPLSRQSLREEQRPDGLKVVNIAFTTSYIDRSVDT
jgi:hypothetical protein